MLAEMQKNKNERNYSRNDPRYGIRNIYALKGKEIFKYRKQPNDTQQTSSDKRYDRRGHRLSERAENSAVYLHPSKEEIGKSFALHSDHCGAIGYR
jgi:hypothetical protein